MKRAQRVRCAGCSSHWAVGSAAKGLVRMAEPGLIKCSVGRVDLTMVERPAASPASRGTAKNIFVEEKRKKKKRL